MEAPSGDDARRSSGGQHGQVAVEGGPPVAGPETGGLEPGEVEDAVARPRREAGLVGRVLGRAHPAHVAGVAPAGGEDDRGVCPSVVDDQVGRPTAADDLAAAVAHLVQHGASGTYNATGGGEPASWADVAEVVFAARGRDPGDVRRVSTAEYTADKPGLAPRPLNSVLDLTRLQATGFRPRDWRAALGAHLSPLPA